MRLPPGPCPGGREARPRQVNPAPSRSIGG
jgi:hypothetical protein